MPSFFQGGGSNKTTHAYSLSLGCLCDFLLLLFGVVRNDSLSDDSRELPSGKSYRFFFHRPDRSTTRGGRLDPSLGYEPLYVTFTVKVEPNTKKLIPGWELGFRAVPRDQRAELIFRHHVFRHDSSWLVSRAAAGPPPHQVSHFGVRSGTFAPSNSPSLRLADVTVFSTPVSCKKDSFQFVGDRSNCTVMARQPIEC